MGRQRDRGTSSLARFLGLPFTGWLTTPTSSQEEWKTLFNLEKKMFKLNGVTVELPKLETFDGV